MKVIGNDGLYVQAKDIEFLTLTSNKNIPFSILDKYDGNLDGNEFIKYTNKKDIRFLNKLNWLNLDIEEFEYRRWRYYNHRTVYCQI